ncbi:MAG: phosphoribosylformylglycinamidine cyclo-ligase [Candidatus Omnitrophica bacterium]|nr:phosphoribosylformylglycinamidine cyclo-ligase [Candidatus Omnitrophota bacterium]
MTYKTSGVDIDKAEDFVRSIGREVKSTFTSAVLNRTTAFGSLFEISRKKYKEPVIASSTDGVGTKLLIAQALGIHNTVGIDLVAMNVNDILCVGARPLFFLDYIACGKIDIKVLNAVVSGIAAGCRQAGCSLIGGETAEMPGLYGPNEYDLAGFAVGIVEKKRIIDGQRIKVGDIAVGLPSSGPHSNGYSLIRKALRPAQLKKFAKQVMAPTRIYAQEVKAVTRDLEVKGIAHVTGGAYFDKVTKILPAGKCFSLDIKSWPVPDILRIVQQQGQVERDEMYRTFNMGIGMVMVFAPAEMPRARKFFHKNKINFYEIGEVVADRKRKMILS